MWNGVPPTSYGPVSLLLVNAPILLPSTLQAALRSCPSLNIVGEATHVVPNHLYALKPQVAVLAVAGNSESFLTVVRDLQTLWPSIGIIAISVLPSTDQLRMLTCAGVNGYLTWHASLSDLLSVILVVSRGGNAYGSHSTTMLKDCLMPSRAPQESQVPLSPREVEVVIQVAQGHSNCEIAATLRISIKTVECHISRILHKFGVRSRVELATAWVRHHHMPERAVSEDLAPILGSCSLQELALGGDAFA